MRAQEIILKKRNGHALSKDDIDTFIRGVTDESISDSQIAAFTMATWFTGMSAAETVDLTLAMRDSGDVLDWRDWDRPIADKHSTGGVGDNVSLMLAPIAAACGLAVPMISGRGLGHTGGTLDKLEAIPGYQIHQPSDRFRAVVKDIGCAIVGPTARLAPADKRIYAVRDVTSTVDNIALITASILSKKLASGLQTLVLDVKVGSGSFMTEREDAERLARTLVEVANGAGLKTSAFITDMNEPLADSVGNGLEVDTCLRFLKGELAGSRLETVVYALAAEMLVSSGIETSVASAQLRVDRAVQSGAALDCFARMVNRLGGPADFVERSDSYLAKAPVIRPVLADQAGYLAACDAISLGQGLVGLGGGRRLANDHIDHRVGFSGLKPLGSKLEKGDAFALVHARNDAEADTGAAMIKQAYSWSEQPPVLHGPIVSQV
jgi:thymidine phosphorylase